MQRQMSEGDTTAMTDTRECDQQAAAVPAAAAEAVTTTAINTPEANDIVANLDDVLSTIVSFLEVNRHENQIIAMSNIILDTLESLMEHLRPRNMAGPTKRPRLAS